MWECFTCKGAANERYTMVLDAGTELEDVIMCDDCHDSHSEVSWIEIRDGSLLTRDSTLGLVTEVSD